MKTLYLDCSRGVAGDMFVAALAGLFPERERIAAELNALGIPDVVYELTEKKGGGIVGLAVRVLVAGVSEGELDHVYAPGDGSGHDHAHGHGESYAPSAGEPTVHHHRSLHDIEQIIGGLRAPQRVKDTALRIYTSIAQAEAQVHGSVPGEVHFHEVGTLDAIADVVGASYLMDKLGEVQVYASPVQVGSGEVVCAHGTLPVPAPATALLLEGIPSYGSEIQGELCTPTGAALVRAFVDTFGAQPCMSVERIGYGFGTKAFVMPNCLRAFYGVAQDMLGASSSHEGIVREHIVELTCTIDDMSAEGIGFACQELLDAGALDVFATPVHMKKWRSATLLTVVCAPELADTFAHKMLTLTTTLGVRKKTCERYALARHTEVRQTPYGPLRIKIAQGGGIRRAKAEYDDLARIAHEHGVSLDTARNLVRGEHVDDESA